METYLQGVKLVGGRGGPRGGGGRGRQGRPSIVVVALGIAHKVDGVSCHSHSIQIAVPALTASSGHA